MLLEKSRFSYILDFINLTILIFFFLVIIRLFFFSLSQKL